MIKNRKKEAAIGIISALVISLLMFSLKGGGIEFSKGITGFASYGEYEQHKNQVIVSGIEFMAVIGGEEAYFIFSDNGKWYEKKEDFVWEKRVDMGDSIWSGIAYLKSYDARIYFKDKEIKDVAEFARGFR